MDYVMGADSECSSGCESGWTLYFENSSVSLQDNGEERCEFRSIGKERMEEEEEDMSMVSDASSGPPHFAEEDDALWKQRGKKQKLKESKKLKKREDVYVEKQKSSLLDDTASSPVFNPPNQNYKSEAVLDVSKGYSTTQFQMQGNSAYQEEYQHGYFQYPPSLSGNYMQQNQWFAGSVWQP